TFHASRPCQGRPSGFPQHAMWPPAQAYHHPQQASATQASVELLGAVDFGLTLQSELSLLRSSLVAEVRQAKPEMLSEVASSIRTLHQDMALQLRQVQQDMAVRMQQQRRHLVVQAAQAAGTATGISTQPSQAGRHLANHEQVLRVSRQGC
ncbi:hypothetical protein Vafri_1156, partial [Volvox africanus]